MKFFKSGDIVVPVDGGEPRTVEKYIAESPYPGNDILICVRFEGSELIKSMEVEKMLKLAK